MKFFLRNKTTTTTASALSGAGARRLIFFVFSLTLLGFSILAGCGPRPVHEQAPIDLTGAIARAKADHKLVLMDFTGSDYCEPCIKLDKEVFSQPAFQAYAETNLVFLTVDFPSGFQLPPAAQATNALLAAQFTIDGYPTLIALDGEGKEVWRHNGGLDGGQNQLAAEISAVKSKAL